MQASGPSAVTRELVNGVGRSVEQGPPRADLEASRNGKSDEDSLGRVGRDHFNDLQSLHGDTVRNLPPGRTVGSVTKWGSPRAEAPSHRHTVLTGGSAARHHRVAVLRLCRRLAAMSAHRAALELTGVQPLPPHPTACMTPIHLRPFAHGKQRQAAVGTDALMRPRR